MVKSLDMGVADNLPNNVPVTQQEMEVIETYLAALVEDCWI